MSGSVQSLDEHRDFLNRYYGATRRVYDATRKPYLLGRDRALTMLLSEPWTSIVEVGFGTGRNLQRLRSRRPTAKYGGIDACDAMVEHARERCPWASLEHGYAEDADIEAVHGQAPDRILFSYALSMIPEPDRALDRALAALARAELGVSMGSGADVAATAASLVIMGSSLDRVLAAFEIARRTRRVVRQNLFWAFAYNAVGISLAVAGVLTPIVAAGAMLLSSLSVITNSRRLGR